MKQLLPAPLAAYLVAGIVPPSFAASRLEQIYGIIRATGKERAAGIGNKVTVFRPISE